MNIFFGLLVMEISENLSRGINAFHGERVQGVSTFTSSILYFRFKILLKKALKDAFCFLAKPIFLILFAFRFRVRFRFGFRTSFGFNILVE